jgi:hypothetical protein
VNWTKELAETETGIGIRVERAEMAEISIVMV